MDLHCLTFNLLQEIYVIYPCESMMDLHCLTFNLLQEIYVIYPCECMMDFTLVDIQSLARDLFMWSSTLVSLWWIYIAWHSMSCNWSTKIAFNLHTRFAHFVCYKILWLGFLKWCKIYFQGVTSHTPLEASKSCHKFGHLDLWVGWSSMGYIMGEYYYKET
jgi:hypothetical protein